MLNETERYRDTTDGLLWQLSCRVTNSSTKGLRCLVLCVFNFITDQWRNQPDNLVLPCKFPIIIIIHFFISFQRTSCYKSANKLYQVCSQVVNKLCSHGLFLVCNKLDGIIRLVTRLFQQV